MKCGPTASEGVMHPTIKERVRLKVVLGRNGFKIISHWQLGPFDVSAISKNNSDLLLAVLSISNLDKTRFDLDNTRL